MRTTTTLTFTISQEVIDAIDRACKRLLQKHIEADRKYWTAVLGVDPDSSFEELFEAYQQYEQYLQETIKELAVVTLALQRGRVIRTLTLQNVRNRIRELRNRILRSTGRTSMSCMDRSLQTVPTPPLSFCMSA